METLACIIGNLTDARNLNEPWNKFLKTETIAEQMKLAGWCLTEPTLRNGSRTLHYLSELEQPAIKDHSLCFGDMCSADSIIWRRARPYIGAKTSTVEYFVLKIGKCCVFCRTLNRSAEHCDR